MTVGSGTNLVTIGGTTHDLIVYSGGVYLDTANEDFVVYLGSFRDDNLVGGFNFKLDINGLICHNVMASGSISAASYTGTNATPALFPQGATVGTLIVDEIDPSGATIMLNASTNVSGDLTATALHGDGGDVTGIFLANTDAVAGTGISINTGTISVNTGTGGFVQKTGTGAAVIGSGTLILGNAFSGTVSVSGAAVGDAVIIHYPSSSAALVSIKGVVTSTGTVRIDVMSSGTTIFSTSTIPFHTEN